MGLETVEILLDIEDYFDIHIPDSAAMASVTVADLQQVIVDLLVLQGMPVNEKLRAEVWQGIMTVLKKNRYPIDDIRPESKWVGDITKYG